MRTLGVLVGLGSAACGDPLTSRTHLGDFAPALQLTHVVSPAPFGQAQTFAITSVDPYGQVATDFTGSVHFSSDDPAALLPPDTRFVPGDAGVKVMVAGLTLWRASVVSAADVAQEY